MKCKYGLFVVLATILICYILPFVNLNQVIFAQHQQSLNRNVQSFKFQTELKDKFVPLPESVISRVKYFVYFVGRAHSGHSIVGSILDSHPHMIVANEAKIFVQLKENPAHFTSKDAIFNELWRNSYNVSHYSGGLRSSDSYDIQNKGYSLQINELYQGTYLSHVDVIGDKNGGNTVSIFHRNPLEWEKIFDQLHGLVKIPFKVIYVIRNPYDNIVSSQLYHSFNMSTIRSSSEIFVISGEKHKAYVHQIDKHFASHQAIMDAKKQYNWDLLEIHVKDLVEHPNATITKMCNFLGVHCSESYIQACSKILFKTESKVRYKVKWTLDLISKVKKHILKYDNLLRYYSFDT